MRPFPAWIDRSLKNLETDAIDLLQLHCPHPDIFYRPEVFSILDDLVKAGKLRHYGVSVEKVEEALKAIEFPGVQSVQIIFNLFRQRPAELFFKEAHRRKIGILARVPLASGLLSGKITRARKFAKDDHRNFNRHGEAFDRGETFAGVDFATGLRAVEALKAFVPEGATLAQLALRWILEFPAVTCAIPGAKRPAQVAENNEHPRDESVAATRRHAGATGVALDSGISRCHLRDSRRQTPGTGRGKHRRFRSPTAIQSHDENDWQRL